MKRKQSLILLFLMLLAACAPKDAVVYDLADTPAVEETAERAGAQAEEEPAGKAQAQIWIYVCGQVAQPGVYALPAGSRVYEAVEAAGGFLEDADLRHLNQAELLSDGQQIIVYSTEETQNAGESGTQNGGSGKVNLNLADKEQLMTLPGVGEARAEEILRYRSEHGAFSSIEEIQNIPGIKEKMFEKIKEYIEI